MASSAALRAFSSLIDAAFALSQGTKNAVKIVPKSPNKPLTMAMMVCLQISSIFFSFI